MLHARDGEYEAMICCYRAIWHAVEGGLRIFLSRFAGLFELKDDNRIEVAQPFFDAVENELWSGM